MRKFCTILFLLCSCRSQNNKIISAAYQTYESTDTGLHWKNGYWYKSGDLVTGKIIEHYLDSGIKTIINYKQGKEDGWKKCYYPGGTLAEQRYYINGEKDSLHSGWWPNGNKRFEYHFANGVYDGDYLEWYQSGKRLKYIHYTKGIEDSAKGWRENGKLYMNFIVRNGRRYGIENSNLCYTIKNEKGEYVNNSQ